MANNVTANPGSGGATFATFNSAALVNTPVSIGGHQAAVSTRANYTSAQTNTALKTPTSGKRLICTRVRVAADNANSVDVAVVIGFAAATTPTGAGVAYSHPGLPSGLSDGDGNGGGILAIGGVDEPLLITSEVATGGSIDVIVTTIEVEAS